jgi:hypothetical protein
MVAQKNLQKMEQFNMTYQKTSAFLYNPPRPASLKSPMVIWLHEALVKALLMSMAA